MAISLNYSLKKHNSWQLPSIGEKVYIPESIQELCNVIKEIQHFGLWLGLGSNILLPDIIKSPVILTQKHLNKLEVKDTGIYVQAGVTCAKTAKQCIANGYEDSIFFGGIPGTIGGALQMNAGAFGFETWSFVNYVDVIDSQGNCHQLSPDQFQINYRHIIPPFPLRFIGAMFHFKPGNTLRASEKLKGLMAKRNATQPIGTFNCGSVFRNPYPQHAAFLIESCGLKGFSYHGAQVSEKHANFIINTGSASYQSILFVIRHVQKIVLDVTGINLTNEVIILED